MNTSAITWAAAQAGEADWKFLGGLTPEDEKKIEIAYAEWRARLAAGEKRPKVDWKAIVLPEPVPVEAAPAQAVPVAAVEAAPAVPNEPAAPDDPIPTADDDADPDVAEAVERVEEILGEEHTEEYISLDDFNFEPSEAEMKAMEASIEAESEKTVAEPSEDAVPEDGMKAASGDSVDVMPEEDAMPEDDVAVPIEQRIAKLSKDADPAVYAELLSALAGDVDIAKSVTEAVMRDQTRRHRGTAAQRQFLTWLSTKGGEDRE